jgi:hypothetical protein
MNLEVALHTFSSLAIFLRGRMLVFRHSPNVTPSHQSFFFIDKNLAKKIYQIIKNSKKSDFGGFQSPEVRGESNKNRQSSIFEFQFIAKSREKLLINIWFMVIFWLHLPKG